MKPMTLIMNNNKLKPDVIHALTAVLSLQALVILLDELLSDIYTRAFEQFKPVVDEEWNSQSRRQSIKGGDAIVSRHSLYLASEQTIKDVMSFVVAEANQKGVNTCELCCPLERAQLRLRDAEDALINAMTPITDVTANQLNQTTRAQAIDLTLNLLISAAEEQGFNLNVFKIASERLTLGERMEAVMLTRETGLHGEYLGSTAEVFATVKIDGVQYAIKRSVEVDAPWYWHVTNLSSGGTAEFSDRYDLARLTFL